MAGRRGGEGSGWGGGGVDVIEELKFLGKFTKKISGGGGGGGVRVDVNEELKFLGVGGDVGYGDVNQE